MFQGEYIFIIHIFKFYPRIVKKFLHLNLKPNGYNVLMRFKENVMFTITGFETIFLQTQNNIIFRKTVDFTPTKS